MRIMELLSGWFGKHEKPCKINELPNEALDLIFSKLDDKDHHSVAVVCSRWNCVMINLAKSREVAVVNKVILFLLHHINHKVYKTELKQLRAIRRNDLLEQSDCLKAISSNVYKIRVELVSCLKTLQISSLKRLNIKYQSMSAYPFFANLIELAKIEKKLEAAKKITDYMQQTALLCDVIRQLAINNDMVKAIEIGEGISEPFLHDLVLLDISQMLLVKGQTSMATRVKMMIPPPSPEELPITII